MIDNTNATTHPFVHVKSQPCPACDDGEDHFFTCFHMEEGNIEQCSTCSTQFDGDGIPLEEPIMEFE